jgi:hypothetical protein
MASDDPSRTSSDEQNLGVRKAQSDPLIGANALGFATKLLTKAASRG